LSGKNRRSLETDSPTNRKADGSPAGASVNAYLHGRLICSDTGKLALALKFGLLQRISLFPASRDLPLFRL
jgi:hypothetical protein